MTKFCVYQIGYNVIHAIGETESECKADYLQQNGEEFNGEENYSFGGFIGDMVLVPCSDVLYNYVHQFGGNLGKTVEMDKGILRFSH